VRKMMSKKQFEELLKSLKGIEDKMEILINLQKTILPKPSLGEEEKKVLKLCDRKHTIDDIVRETGKSENNVNVILSRLRDKRLMRSVEIKNRLVYEKI
jgi:transcription initiation factor IIE alpha subunit